MVQIIKYLLIVFTLPLAYTSSPYVSADSGIMSTDELGYSRKLSKRKPGKGGKSGKSSSSDDDEWNDTTLPARFSGVDQASGAQERVGDPPKAVDTKTTATVEWKFDGGFTKMDFKISIFKGVNVTLVHFHCAQAGKNGPVIVSFFSGAQDVNGIFLEGNIKNNNVTCSEDGVDFCNCDGLEVNNMPSLYQAMKNGLVYLNVHTSANPDGEVRGQIFTS